MNWQGNAIIFGSFGAILGLILGGVFVWNVAGAIMIGVGIIGALIWVYFVFDILTAMSSDI